MLKEKYLFKRNANKLLKNGIISFLTSDFEMFYVFQIIPKNPLKLSSFRQKSNEFCIHKPKLHISSTLESEMHLGQGMNVAPLTLIGMRQGGFKYLPYNLGLDFVS